MIKLKIALLEDNPGDQILIEEALKGSDRLEDIIKFDDGEDLIKASKEGSLIDFCPQLFLLDINLPRIGGLEILKQLRGPKSNYRSTPVIMLSTSSFDHDIERAYQNGAFGYLVKSSEFEVLQSNITTIMDYWSETMSLADSNKSRSI